MEKRIICICGIKGSGKDTLTKQIMENEKGEREYLHLKVSTMLKRVCSIVFGLPYETFERQTLKEKELEEYEGRTPREIMQFMGTEVLQNTMQGLLPKTGKILQIRALINEIKSAEKQNIIISDIRFKHEVEELKREFENVVIIKIKRNQESEKFLNHSSEKEVQMLKEDILIMNNGKKEELYKKYKKFEV